MTKRVQLNGLSLEHLDFTAQKEEWNEYLLADGRTLRIKLILTHVLKSDQTDDIGEPQFVVKTTTVTIASPQPALAS